MRLVSMVLGFALLIGCDDQPLTGPEPPAVSPALAISDASNGGNPHVYFLPPLVKQTASFAGDFDPTLDVSFRICDLVGSECGDVVTTLTMEGGAEPENVQLDLATERYRSGWHTRLHEVADGSTYRVNVVVEDQVLAFADVTLFPSQKEANNANLDETIALRDGGVLNIAVRIEQGAIGEGGGGGGDPTVSVMVEGGTAHTCALDVDGSAYCWGQNLWGALGNNTSFVGSTSDVYIPTPQAVLGGHSFTSLGLGAGTTCGLKSDGSVWCWGSGQFGTLGNGTFTEAASTPVQVSSTQTFIELGLGSFHACARTDAGQIWCWGNGSGGELGNGVQSNSDTPVLVPGTFTDLAVGWNHTCAIATNGTTYCWGGNGYGQVSTSTVTTILAHQAVTTGLVEIFSGHNHTCGVASDGSATCWGRNSHGQLGNGETTTAKTGPNPVGGGHSFVTMDTGGFHTCGLTAAGLTYCWGHNFHGQLGIGTAIAASNQPGDPVAGTWSTLGVGEYHTCGHTTEHVLMCWGRNGDGQLGTGNTTSSPLPVGVLSFSSP